LRHRAPHAPRLTFHMLCGNCYPSPSRGAAGPRRPAESPTGQGQTHTAANSVRRLQAAAGRSQGEGWEWGDAVSCFASSRATPTRAAHGYGSGLLARLGSCSAKKCGFTNGPAIIEIGWWGRSRISGIPGNITRSGPALPGSAAGAAAGLSGPGMIPPVPGRGRLPACLPTAPKGEPFVVHCFGGAENKNLPGHPRAAVLVAWPKAPSRPHKDKLHRSDEPWFAASHVSGPWHTALSAFEYPSLDAAAPSRHPGDHRYDQR
jgi:hypothetical protein